jgi:hypothetical protein
MAQTGTHTLADLQAITDRTVVQFGIENVLPVIQQELDAHNRVVDDMVADFASRTTEREEPVGGTTSFDMEIADEFNRPRTQKPGAPDKVGYPLDRFTVGIGWTAEFFQKATPAALVERLLETEAAHVRQLIKSIRKSLMASVNFSFTPYIEDIRDVAVTVRALYNADGFVPPVGPNLEQFVGSHNHYLGSATLTNAAVGSLITHIAEHSRRSSIRIYINKADEAAWRALTDFRPYLDMRERPSLTRDVANVPLEVLVTDDRAIGIIQGAEVWTKPWMVSNYALGVNITAPDKALRMREPTDVNRRGLRPIAEVATFPYQARVFEALFGFGVYNRGAAAVLQFNNATYTAPVGL